MEVPNSIYSDNFVVYTASLLRWRWEVANSIHSDNFVVYKALLLNNDGCNRKHQMEISSIVMAFSGVAMIGSYSDPLFKFFICHCQCNVLVYK